MAVKPPFESRTASPFIQSSRVIDRPQHLRPVRRTPRPRHLRGDLGRSGFHNPEYARHPQRRCRALKAIKVPNVRWPGGCFADEYHWRKGSARSTSERRAQPQLGRRDRAEHFWDARIHGLHRPDRQRGVRLSQCGLRHSAGGRGMAGIHDRRAADDAGQGARRERPSRSLQGRLSRHRQRKLGLRRQHDARLLSEPD
jgi:hypothetical protein